ncbi:MAG: thiamine biosynthesis protein ThiS [Desulfuromonas sp.]|nr:MAG: thiamine biosynthesis protein ThiS [Desulfuromonas sp.]
MEIAVNSKQHQVASGTTIGQLLEQLKLDPARVAVERNLEVVPKDEFDRIALAAGDTLEIVQFVGGG